jgi:predicted ArsR family transcriptional regulator
VKTVTVRLPSRLPPVATGLPAGTEAPAPLHETPLDTPLATRRRVTRSLLENGPSTAAQLAERMTVTPAAVRRHLDALVGDGLVESREQRVRGRRGRGRPARVFAVTDAGRGQFQHAYDDLATSALRFLSARAGEQAVTDFARERVQGLGEQVAPTVTAAPPGDRVEALATALTAQGYAASTRATEAGGAQLCQHHCPVAHVAEQFPQLCEAETELFARLLGTHVQRLATIAHGDGVCTTHVPGRTPGTTPVPGRPPHASTPTTAASAPSSRRIPS